MTDETMMQLLVSLRAQVGAMQATIDTLGRALEERIEHKDVQRAVTECQHVETEDWGSTLRTSRRRCMNPQCRKIITSGTDSAETLSPGDHP
jgi:hypothetical protein